MKIEHLLRGEREGGFWFIRNEGRATEVDGEQFSFLVRLASSTGSEGLFRSKLDAAVGFTRTSGGRDLLRRLRVYGLDRVESWDNVRVVLPEVPLDDLPTNAVAAPKRIYFEITRSCNLRCRSCFNQSGTPLPGELSFEEILNVNRRASQLGVFEIRYTGGECTRVAGFAKIVADARKRGMYVSIGTNGIYSDDQLEWISTCGIDWFIISLDGGRDLNDRVRGKGSFDQVMRTLQHLKKNPTRIRLNMVVAKHNVEAIEDVAAIAQEFGVETLNLIPLRPYGRSTREMSREMFAQKDFYDFIRVVNGLRLKFPGIIFSTTIDLLDPTATTSHDLIVQKKSTCAAGVEACVIGPLGHVYGCSYSPASFPTTATHKEQKIFIAGNVRGEDLGAIWRDSTRWAVFRDLGKYKNPKCHTCSHYKERCSGSCQIMAWYQLKRGESTGREIRDFLDPYCFVDLLDRQSKGGTADLAAPCRGSGMDGF